MLRRADSKSSNHLTRRKSTSSIHTKQVYLDPEVARQHAQAAAMHAFARAQERNSIELRLRASQANYINTTEQDDLPGQKSRGVKRQQSVRFVGPHAVGGRQSLGTRALQSTAREKTSSASLRPRVLTNEVPVPAAYRPPSRSSSLGKASTGKGTAESFATALAAYDEYYLREDDIASTPSSYRRIRKSQSTKTLFSPLKAPSALFHNGTPDRNYNAKIWNKVPWIQNQDRQATLKAPKSMSFLRGGRDHLTATVRQDRDIAVQVARDKFLHQIEQQRLREQPSLLFRTKARRADKPFRQSVRSGSTNSYGIPVASAILPTQSKEGSIRSKARKASQTIKRKLKSFFHLGGNEREEVLLPSQQVESRKSHRRGSIMKVTSASQDEFLDIPHPNSAAVSRVASRAPSMHTVASSQRLRSRTGSVHSLRSEDSGKSRVTSWTSTADNTMTSRQAHAERERQRLSIIQENGTHMSSSSLVRPVISNQFSAYPAFHRPRNAKIRAPPLPSPVDSQRVYSALMKKLDESSPSTAPGLQRVASSEILGPKKRVPPRSSSIGSQQSSRGSRTPATIRHVREDFPERDDNVVEQDGGTLTSLPHETDDVFSPEPSSDTSSTRLRLQEKSFMMPQMPIYNAYPILKTSDESILTPQQMASRNELLMKPSTALRETRSTFFGNSSFTVRRSTSPYRRALAETDYNPVIVMGKLTAGTGPNRVLFPPPIVNCSDPIDLDTQNNYTESIYSRTTSGRTPAEDSPHSQVLLGSDVAFSDRGPITLAARATYRPEPPMQHVVSTTESTEWKSWLSAEVSRKENVAGLDSLIKVDYALPSMPHSFGHVREPAQITGDDTQISQRKFSMSKQPIGIIQQSDQPKVHLKPILKHKPPQLLAGIPTPPPLPPPPVPIRSPLRPTQSRGSLRSINSQQTLGGPPSAIKVTPISGYQLLPLSSSMNIPGTSTPGKLTKRYGGPLNTSNPSLGIGAAVEKQFGTIGLKKPYTGAENFSPNDMSRNEHHGSDSAGPIGTSELDTQTLGSKSMVDLFLHSRRKRLADSDEGHAFL